jgi:hypothetical protein
LIARNGASHSIGIGATLSHSSETPVTCSILGSSLRRSG